MKVKTLIDLLSRENPEAHLYLRDPDSEFILPLRWGDNPDAPLCDGEDILSVGFKCPANGVMLHAIYSQDKGEDVEK